MSLKVYYSDRIEDLAAHLKERLLAERAGLDPFVFSQVAVPNANIAKWLQIRVFAGERTLCAGIAFPFIEQRLTELMSANLPAGAPFSLLPMNAYANAIMSALLAPEEPSAEFAALAPLRAYISGDDGASALRISTQRQARMAWQLAAKMADLMDQYEVRRPEIVEKWLAGESVRGADGIEAAEAALARRLWGRDGAFPPDGDRLSLRQLYDRVRGSPPSGDRRTIYFFGHSTLSLLQVKILVWLAQTHDVVFYHNNVCLEYWGDIETKEERIRRMGRSHAEEEDLSVENPLLQQWGVAGRETMRLLVELEEECGGHIDFEWRCVAESGAARRGTVLGSIQESICRRTGESAKTPQDASLQIVGTPGIRREVEMVYNAIIGSVWKPEDSGERPWPDCGFSDIAVLVPDMAEYRPAIEAVFDARGDVPYGLIDTTAAEDSSFLAGFLAIADVARHGLTRETLFAVLDNPCAQKALGFSAPDVAAWRGLADAAGAFDGFEARADGSKFNWDWALSRLRLARAADSLPVAGEPDAELPLVGDGGDSSLKFSETVELLYRRIRAAFRNRSGGRRALPCADEAPAGERMRANWAFTLSRLMDDLLAVPDDDPLESGVRRQIVQTLNGLSAIPGEQDCETVLAAVEQFVGGVACRRGGYLTHGVTIAGLQPMRPVPFRQVFVLGLGADGFPGRAGSSTLDVRGAGWRLGDVTAPKVNRYLFLETLMSARDRLVLSYRNRDIEKDAELFPSGIVRELEDFAGAAILDKPFEEFAGYPLLEHGEPGAASPACAISWRRSDPFAGLLPTYSKSARALAGRVSAARARKTDDSARQAAPSVREPDVLEVSARELAEFLKSPFDTVLKRRLGIATEGFRDTELDVDPPLGVPGGPAEWELQGAALDGDESLDRQFRRMQLAGALPAGFIGDFAKKRFTDGISESIGALRSFAESFGVKGGGDGSALVSRQSVQTTVTRADGRSAKVRFVAETPNWKESGDEVSVLVPGWLKGLSKNAAPVDRTLALFFAFLMHLAGRSGGGADSPRFLRVGVIDVANAGTAVWRWSVSPFEAAAYLERIAARYLDFLETAATPSGYIDFSWKKFAKALEGGGDWTRILDALTKEEFRPGGAKAAFDGSLVVAQAADRYRRDPTAEELERLYDDFYRLPMSAVRDDDTDGGAE